SSWWIGQTGYLKSVRTPSPTAAFSSLMSKRKFTAEELFALAESNDYKRGLIERKIVSWVGLMRHACLAFLAGLGVGDEMRRRARHAVKVRIEVDAAVGRRRRHRGAKWRRGAVGGGSSAGCRR